MKKFRIALSVCSALKTSATYAVNLEVGKPVPAANVAGIGEILGA